MSTLEVRDAVEDDWPGIKLLTAVSYGANWRDETIAAWRSLMPPRASVVVSDGPDVVAMAHYIDLEMTVPGGATLPCAGITWVGVAPTHRRRGLLRAMYTELHQRISDAGYPLAGLTATEGGIYGRFGYGPASTDVAISLDRRFAQFHRDAADPGGVRTVRPGEHRDELAAIYDRYRRQTPGAQLRLTALWDDVLADWEDSRRGGTPWLCFLHPDGYALYRIHRDTSRTVRVEDLTAVTQEAHVALWRALAGLDLVETVSVTTHPSDSLPYLLTDARLARIAGAEDGLWLRLMDVPATLCARRYLADVSTVIEVDDQFRSDGGRFALEIRDGEATCERTDAPAEFSAGLDVLGSLYLGVHSASTLAAAGRLRSGDPVQLARLDAAFRSDVPARIGFNF